MNLYTKPSDPRVSLLSLDGKRVLDVGCNAGKATIEIAKYFNCQVLGIDLDGDLIKKANSQLRMIASLIEPEEPLEAKNSLLPQFSNAKTLDLHYFPISMPLMFGYVPINKTESKLFKFPYNLQFMKADIMKDSEKLQTYDVIILFSIVKWIHLNHGDQGIMKLVSIVSELLADEGEVWVEPQTAESYAKHIWIFEEEAKSKDPSLTMNLIPIPDGERKSIWDVFIQAGFRGIVVKENEEGKGFDTRPIWRFVKKL